MRVILCGLLVAISVCTHAQDKKKKPPDVQVVETKGRRDEGRVMLDGKVRVTAEKPLKGLVVVFDFISPEHAVISSEKTMVDEDLMSHGAEGVYHAETRDPVRAVQYKIRAFDKNERELRVDNDGPFIIE